MTIVQGPNGGMWMVTEYDPGLEDILGSLGMEVQIPDAGDQAGDAPKMLVKLQQRRCT